MTSEAPYADPGLETEARVEDLLDRMTLQEKVGQLVGMFVGSFIDSHRGSTETWTLDDIESAIEEYYIGSVTPFGTGVTEYNNVAVAGRIANRLQRKAVTETRLGIPLLVPVDAIHGHANMEGSTVFPQNLGMAATWDPELVEHAARITATEMAATGANQNYSPTADVAREPRWGRVYETYGESTSMVGEFVAAEVRGLQGSDLSDSTSVAATVKHFPASSAPVRGEDTSPVDISKATLRRVYLPPFERAIDEDVAGVMPMYNAIGNEPAHASEYYLTDMLRDELGFEGVSCSDWLGIWMLAERHRVATSHTDAVAQVTTAGLDIASIGGPEHATALLNLVEAGRIPESHIDETVRRILSLKFDLGLFEDPYVPSNASDETVGTRAHRQVALEAARKSLTLLQNQDDVLPLTDIDELFVTGPNADSLDALLGGWTVLGFDESEGETVRSGLENAVAPSASVGYEPGIEDNSVQSPDTLQEQASSADAAVVVLGESWYVHEFGPLSETGSKSEFPKRNQLRLPDEQQRLVELIGETGTPTIVVTVTGRPLILTDIVDQVDGIIAAFFPGIEGGNAIADLLLGECAPVGRLPISFPRSMGDLPVRHDWLPHPSPIGNPAHPSSYDPLFEFGYGLSYTEFEYQSIDVAGGAVTGDSGVTARVSLTNIGDSSGTETVQLYGQHLESSMVTPVRELMDFTQIQLSPGESGTVEFSLSPEDFTVIGSDGSASLESGEYELYAGVRSQRLEIK
ncbi:glycoside hydrolase family 3 N-terminal domain-containing protein [Salinarchaeum chitinilyticum]